MAEANFEALVPTEMAEKAVSVGVRKAGASFLNLFMLGVLAGAFIAIGAIFATTIAAGTSGMVAYGIVRLLMGLAFSIGLILVVIGGAELFTGNALIIMAWASRKVSTPLLLRNWLVVYLGNFIGSVATAILAYLSGQYAFGGGVVGKTILNIAVAKVNYGFVQALVLGILCNALVCLAVWLSYSGRTTADRILAIIFPITAFVAAGYEHSIANMYFVPVALFLKQFDPAFAASAAGELHLVLDNLTWGSFLLHNLLPVTLGNIIGGTVMVGIVYWTVYLRNRS